MDPGTADAERGSALPRWAKVRTLLEVCRADAARWVDLGQRVPPTRVTPLVFARLFLQYLPFRATTWFRVGGFLHKCRVPGAPTLVQQFVLRSYGLDIPVATEVGPGLYIAHPVGTTISAERIGANVTIVGAVTLGYRKEGGGPKLGDGVFIGTGARILGPVTVGDDANVGANAVVTKDVPAGCTAVGIPARMVDRSTQPGQYVRARAGPVIGLTASAVPRTHPMRFSVCIPTVRPDTLGPAVQSICRQTVDDWELVVVGQGTEEAALRSATTSAAGGDERVRYVHLDRLGASVARNGGIAASTGELIAFMDDDCEAEPDWLAQLEACFEEGAGFVCGALLAPPKAKRGPGACPEIVPADVTFDRSKDEHPPVGFGVLGANIAVRRADAERVGGFDESIGPGARFGGGEEHDYVHRFANAGVLVRCTPRPVVHHTYGYRYGFAAVRKYRRDRVRGDGAVAAKWTMIAAKGDVDVNAAVREAVRAQLGTVRLTRLPMNALRIAYFLTSYRECLRDYRLDPPGSADPVTSVLARRAPG